MSLTVYTTTNSSVDINELVSDFSQILRDTSKNVLLTKKERKHANKNTNQGKSGIKKVAMH